MKKVLFQTGNQASALILRVVLGLVILPHGLQKTIGAFGGHGWTATMDAFTQGMQLPAIVFILVALLETIGALALILGLCTRLFAIAYFIMFLGIIFTVHVQHGFFMNWHGTQAGEGYEYHILVLGMAFALIFAGGGALSIDRAIYLNPTYTPPPHPRSYTPDDHS